MDEIVALVEQRSQAKALMVSVVSQLNLVEVDRTLVANAAELADTEALRGYDAVHLAASLAVDAGMFVSPDAALCAAARRRGLYVANPLES